MGAIVFLIQCLLVYGLSLAIYNLVKWRFIRTSLDNLPGPSSQSAVKGNMGQFRGPEGIEFQRDLIDHYGGHVVKLHGLFNRPMLYVFDPKALQTILIKDESIWEEPPAYTATNLTLFGPGLLSTLGDQHKKQRRMLNPVFSTTHLRSMLPIFYDTIRKLRDAIEARVRDKPQELDMAGWMGRTALELIGQGGLGYSFDKLVDDTKDPLAIALKLLFPIVTKLTVLPLLLPYLREIIPPSLRGTLARMVPISTAREMKYNADYIAQRSQDIFNMKKRALEQGDAAVAEQIGRGKDIMSILMKANMSASEKDSLPEYELISQMSTLVAAAMDTTSNSLSRVMQILSENPAVQQKLRAEIIEASQGEDMPYERLMQLPYLDAVCRETLLSARIEPSRRAVRDTVIPLSRPIHGTDGKLVTEIAVPKGTEAVIGTLGSNTSQAFWGEDALEWKPERWLSPLPESVTEAGIPSVVGNMMTFLAGKRACIGFKFAEMEIKVVLATLLQSFVFTPSDKDIHWVPAPVIYPAVGEDRMNPRLPLQVAMYSK
ncbi:cytochrome P450 monooxygenase [Fomitopsis serialis]|uniref:cytochrome P450 monooxygenase n=1 Tax=Fomitopsis serialis TaxID=139415 RepID=UPI002008C083|nr:cytochrome P450 monooxygenase [Neoantrodia serialis]KAH9927286.1 cytochrome P450 monooxygenase [Neoantrodia serialis]